MKRVINYLLIYIVCLFVAINNINAECTYQERKDLLNKAKSVDIFIEPKVEVVEKYVTNSFSSVPVKTTYEKYSFDFLVSNMSDDLYIRYYNDLDSGENYISSTDLKDDLYRLTVDDASTLITYFFEIRSNYNNCPGQVFYTKKVVKPIYNYYSEYSICELDNFKEKDYCKKFITKDLNISEKDFFNITQNQLNDKENEKNINTFNVLNFIYNYWYYFVGVLLIVVVGIVFIVISRKRRKLL